MTNNNNHKEQAMTTTSVTTEQVQTDSGWCVVYVTSDGDFGNRFVGFRYETVREVEEATKRCLAIAQSVVQ